MFEMAADGRRHAADTDAQTQHRTPKSKKLENESEATFVGEYFLLTLLCSATPL
jgi:hypothetical protein